MFSFPSPQDLAQLQSFKESNCVTIYAPFIEANAQDNPVRIEIKNLLREAKAMLVSIGVSEKDIQSTLGPIETYMVQSESWPMRGESLVFFSHPHLFRHYRIPPADTPYAVTVQAGFNLDHLLQVMQDNQRYNVLVIGHKNARLYEGDRYHIKPVDIKHFPADMKETLNIDEYSNSRQTHTIGPTSQGKGSEAFHQQYNVRETDKLLLEHFFRIIDRRLHPYVTKNKLPLILAGDSSLMPIYRKVNSYPKLLPGSIAGSQEGVQLQTIREHAWKLLQAEGENEYFEIKQSPNIAKK